MFNISQIRNICYRAIYQIKPSFTMKLSVLLTTLRISQGYAFYLKQKEKIMNIHLLVCE